jgi:hypothetical protein
MNFKKLGLKQLITTSYKPSPIANTQLGLFGKEKIVGTSNGRTKVTANKFIINEVHDMDGDGATNLRDMAKQLKANKNNEWRPLEGDGDFRSPECVELLKRADIVVTNPPFSMFRKYLAQLVEHDKKFLIIANKNSIALRETFQLLKENKIWLGYRNINSDMWFVVPEGAKYEKVVDGKQVKHIMACWITNLDTTKRHEKFVSGVRYSTEKYPKYDNHDAINVERVTDIPDDYNGVMGVPITFLDKYNPEQFDILSYHEPELEVSKAQSIGKTIYQSRVVNRNGYKTLKVYHRLFIKRKAIV